METNLKISTRILEEFLQKWTVERLRTMSINEYVDIGNNDTFCQWIETKTKPLGSIKGNDSSKFGIYKRADKNKKHKNLVSDDEYSWLPKTIDNKDEAFANVRDNVYNIAKFAQEGQFDKIDEIDLNHLTKWKIASLYSRGKLVPIFKKESIKASAHILGISFNNSTPYSFLLSNIAQKKPHNITIYQFGDQLLRHLKKLTESSSSFFIIGSKYGLNSDTDVFPLMEKHNAISTGFMSDIDLTEYYNNNDLNLHEKLKYHPDYSQSGYRAIDLFLQIKPGDIVAVKSTGSPRGKKGYLEIIAYALVVDIDGEIYSQNNKLGHCINVEFIKTGIKKPFHLGGYGMAIHRVTKEDALAAIFSQYPSPKSDEVIKSITSRRGRKGTSNISTSGQFRNGHGGYTTNPIHNQIQSKYYDSLVKKYGETRVTMEENCVDIKVKLDDKTIFYEVKPYDLVQSCIEAGIGQLLRYIHHDNSPKEKIIKIIGPSEPTQDDIKLIQFYKETLAIDFDYENFQL